MSENKGAIDNEESSESYDSNDSIESKAKRIRSISESSESESESSSIVDEHVALLRKSDKQINLSQYKEKIEEEYKQIIDECVDKPEIKLTAFNVYKNRYRNILPFEDTRVKLLDSSTDYINANYISEDQPTDAYQNHKYIATQGPLESTVSDFWQMIWQNNTEIIVMVCKIYEKSRLKCYKYWPHNKSIKQFKKGLTVQHVNTKKVEGAIIIRTFCLTKASKQTGGCTKSRQIYQIQLNGWPDFGVPDVDMFIHFMDVYHDYCKMTYLDGYNLIHCSAGVGRTGTFLAIDIGLNQILRFVNQSANENVMMCDIKKIVTYIRTKRGKMIQTAEQYRFVYKVLLQYALNLEQFKKDKDIQKQDSSLFGTIFMVNKLV